MSSRFVSPEHDRLPLSNGDWIEVRRRLNAGEYRAHLRRSSHDGVIDPLDYGLSIVVSYLLDWSLPIQLKDDSGRPFDAASLSSIVDNLDPDDFKEINTVILAHVERQDLARADAKKKTDGTSTSGTTSPSLSDADGPSTTSGA